MYFNIFYKKIKINWVLCEFYEPNTTIITKKILEKTKNVSIISYGNLLCKNKRDLEIIYKILTDEYKRWEEQREKEDKKLPNLILESIKNLTID